MHVRVSSLAFITHISDMWLSLKLKSKRYELVFTDDKNPNYATQNWSQKIKSNSTKYASKLRTKKEKKWKNEWATDNGIESSNSNAYDYNNNNMLTTDDNTDINTYIVLYICTVQMFEETADIVEEWWNARYACICTSKSWFPKK